MEAGQALIATDDNNAAWTTVGKTLLSLTQTNLPSNFEFDDNDDEQEVPDLRVTLPIIEKTCTIKVTFGGYVSFRQGNNVLRIRMGTNTTYLANDEYQNLYCGITTATKEVETFVGSVVVELDLSTQTYVVISMQNDESHGDILSADLARTSVITEIYG